MATIAPRAVSARTAAGRETVDKSRVPTLRKQKTSWPDFNLPPPNVRNFVVSAGFPRNPAATGRPQREMSRWVSTLKPRWPSACAPISASSTSRANADRPSGRLVKAYT